MDHFAAMAYPGCIRPHLIEHAAHEDGNSRFLLRRTLDGDTFAEIQGSTIFCGLSDGARIDFFRRSNPELSHEQIYQSYDLSKDKLREIRQRLKTSGRHPPCRALVLLDDFSASGTSYFREAEGGAKGKVASFLRAVKENEEWRTIVRLPDTKVILTVYVATETALRNIRAGGEQLPGPGRGVFSN